MKAKRRSIVKNTTWDVANNVIVGGNLGSLTIQTGGTMTVWRQSLHPHQRRGWYRGGSAR